MLMPGLTGRRKDALCNLSVWMAIMNVYPARLRVNSFFTDFSPFFLSRSRRVFPPNVYLFNDMQDDQQDRPCGARCVKFASCATRTT